MAQPSTHPPLSPQFCFSTTALRDFLRVSRSSIDDPITQHLNAMVTPARAGFDPSSTSAPRSVDRHLIAPTSCRAFQDILLFPSWQARSDVLNYCALVATSPDPDDPESIWREKESARDKERIVDERLDPYSARFFPREPRTETLASVIRIERGVENIVRERTWRVVTERCGISGERWEDVLDRWNQKRGLRRARAS